MRAVLPPCSRLSLPLAAAAAAEPRGTGDLGLVVERAPGSVQDRRDHTAGRRSAGSRAWATSAMPRPCSAATAATPSCSAATADSPRSICLSARIAKRVVQAGNSIGGAISRRRQRWSRSSNYEPGGVRVFDAATLAPVADIPASCGATTASAPRPWAWSTLPGRRFAWSASTTPARSGSPTSTTRRTPRDPSASQASASCPTTATSRPTAATTSPACSARTASRSSICGIPTASAAPHPRRLRPRRGAAAGLQDAAPRGLGRAPATLLFLPAVGRHELLVVDRGTWEEAGRIPVARPARVRRGPARWAPGLGQLRPPGQ